MIDFGKSLYTGLLFLFCSTPLLALQADTGVPASEQPERNNSDPATQRENPSSAVPYESGRVGEPTCEDRWSNFLPFLGKAACELGYVLPRPFGVSAGYMHQDQPFDVVFIF